MKNIDLEKIKNGVIVTLILVIVFGASYFTSELKECGNKDSSVNSQESGESLLTNISIDDYLSFKEGTDAAIIYVARPTCTYCQEEEPILNDIVSEYGITVNYLNTDELDDEGQSKLINSDDYFSEGYGTPLLLIVKDNKIVDKIEGLTSKDEIVDFFKEYNFIN